MNHVTLTAAKIAEMVNGKLIGSPDRTISSVSGIRDAQSDQLSFIGNKSHVAAHANKNIGTQILFYRSNRKRYIMSSNHRRTKLASQKGFCR